MQEFTHLLMVCIHLRSYLQPRQLYLSMWKGRCFRQVITGIKQLHQSMHYQNLIPGIGSCVTKGYGVDIEHHFQTQKMHAPSYRDAVVWSLALAIANVAKVASDAPACASAEEGALLTHMTDDIMMQPLKWKWISNSIPQFIRHVITYPRWD